MNEILTSTSAQNLIGVAGALGWFDVTQEDRDRVCALKPMVAAHIDDIIEAYYKRAGSFEHARYHKGEHAQLAQIKAEQKRHFEELVDAALDDGYFERRKLAGSFNEMSGVTAAFYMSSYSFFHRRMTALIFEQDGKTEAAFEKIESLHKVSACHKALTMESFLEARENTIQDRERQISELPVPVLRLREGLLLVPVVGTLDSHRARLLTVQMLEAIRDQEARAVVLDITGVAAVDSAVANHLIQTMSAARLMGAHSVLTGITSEVAQSLVKVGVTGEDLNPAGDLQQGIRRAEKLLEV